MLVDMPNCIERKSILSHAQWIHGRNQSLKHIPRSIVKFSDPRIKSQETDTSAIGPKHKKQKKDHHAKLSVQPIDKLSNNNMKFFTLPLLSSMVPRMKNISLSKPSYQRVPVQIYCLQSMYFAVEYPFDDDYNHVNRIIRYLTSTIGYGLCFYGNMRANHIFAYCDAAFGVDENYASCTGG